MDVPIGTVVPYAGEVVDNNAVVEVERGWLLCNGAALSSQQYDKLYQKIQTAHGNASNDSNPATDFNLPDYRGLFLRGVAHSRTDRDPNTTDRDRPANNRGGNVGNRVGSIQDDAFEQHNHDAATTLDPSTHKHSATTKIDPSSHSHTYREPAGGGGSGAPGGQGLQDKPTSSVTISGSTEIGDTTISASTSISNKGGNENRPKNANVNWIIRAK